MISYSCNIKPAIKCTQTKQLYNLQSNCHPQFDKTSFKVATQHLHERSSKKIVCKRAEFGDSSKLCYSTPYARNHVITSQYEIRQSPLGHKGLSLGFKTYPHNRAHVSFSRFVTILVFMPLFCFGLYISM